MSTYGDNKNEALRAYHGVLEGDTNDMELAWLQAQPNVSAANLVDAWDEFMDSLSITTGEINDRWFEWLSGLGYLDETLTDKFNEFWKNPL